MILVLVGALRPSCMHQISYRSDGGMATETSMGWSWEKYIILGEGISRQNTVEKHGVGGFKLVDMPALSNYVNGNAKQHIGSYPYFVWLRSAQLNTILSCVRYQANGTEDLLRHC